MKNPLVSICCITYNHAPFIRKCLDGFLMQKAPSCVPDNTEMSDWCEILIHDDCSTDGTTEIIKEYAAKYTDLIFPLYEEENQYSKGKSGVIDFYNYKRAKGKYIAYCEGDDYWTNSSKLQIQIDFLEEHTEYSVCIHNTSIYNLLTKQYIEKVAQIDYVEFDVSTEMFLNGKQYIGQPLSMVFRRDIYDYEWQKHYTRYCDTMEIYHLIRVGKCRFLNFIGGRYNIQPCGASASNTDLRRSWESCEDFQQMWDYTRDKCIIQSCLDNYLWRLDICIRERQPLEFVKTINYALTHNFCLGLIVLRKSITKLYKAKLAR